MGFLQESTSSTSDANSETAEVSPRQDSGLPATTPYPTAQWPSVIPNQRQHLPVDPQPQPIVVMIPAMHAPKPIPAVSRRVQQLLPSPQQPAIRVSPVPSAMPHHPSESGVWSSHPTTPAPPRSDNENMSQNVIVVPESSSSRPSYDTPRDQHRRVNQPLPIHPRQSMGSDVIVVPLSSASTPSSTPARGMSRLAQRPSVTSLTGSGGTLRRTPSGRPQRSQTPFVTNPPSPAPTGHTIPGLVVSTPPLSSAVHPAAPQPIVMQQSPQPQPVQRLPSPFPAAVTSTSGSEQNHRAEFPILRRTPGPMADTSFGPIPVPIASTASPVLMPREARGPRMTPHPHPPARIRQHSPVSRPRQVQTPIEATQPTYMGSSPTRLSRRHRPQPEVTLMPSRTESIRRHWPQHTRVDPVTVILPSRPIGKARQYPQPEAIIMPPMRNRQNRQQLDTSIVWPAPAVTAIAYPETVSRVQTTTRPTFVVPQPSLESSHVDFRAALQGAERPVFIRRSPSRLPSRRRPQPTTSIPIEAAQPSRLTRRHRLQPTAADDRIPLPPPRQPEVILMPARTESARSRQNRRRLHPIDTSVTLTRPVTAITYPETVGRGRTTARPATPFITPLPSPTSSDSSPRSSMRAAERPAVLRKSPSHSPNRRRAQSSTIITPTQAAERPAVLRKSPSRSPNRLRAQPSTITSTQAARPSRLTKRRRPQPPIENPQPEIVVMPARTESMRSRQTHRQLHPIEVAPTRAVTAMTYPETVSQVRTTGQPPSIAPVIIPRPISSNSSFRSSTQGIERPVVIRSSPSRRHGPQPTTVIPVPIVPTSQDSEPPLPHTGVVVVPIDSEDDETTAFRPPMSRRASFSGRDMISYGSRTSPNTRSYSSDDDSPQVCVTPSHRGRSRSPYIPTAGTPTSRRSQSPSRTYHPSSTDLWDQKSRTHSQRGWYRRRSSTESSPASISGNTLLQRPAGRGPGHITDRVSVRRHTTFESRGGSRRYDRRAREVVVQRMRGDFDGRGIMLGPEPRLKRQKSAWSKFLSNL